MLVYAYDKDTAKLIGSRLLGTSNVEVDEMRRPNPGAVQIYHPTRGVVISGMQKGPGHPCDAACRAAGHKYKHTFKEPLEVIGLENGDVLLRYKGKK